MEDKAVIARTKAELICSGKLFVPRDIRLPFPVSRSSAGPDAGSESIVVRFPGGRVKLPFSRHDGQLELRGAPDGSFVILRDGRAIVSDVRLERALCHAPGQAFVCLGRSCVMGCLFCTMNEAGGSSKGEMSVQSAYGMILAASSTPGFEAVAITSGMTTTVEEQVRQMARLVSMVRRALPDVPIGVEPLIDSHEQLVALREAGATEAKINLETATEELFAAVCPRRSYDTTIESISWGVDVFGRGRVTSNVIIGLGESDAQSVAAVELLAEKGSVANLRMLRLNRFNRERLESALGELKPVDHERMMMLGNAHAEILQRHRLSTRAFRSMCFPCGCCDLIPEIDI